MEDRILFYGPEWYVFSNFSAFSIQYLSKKFATSEHAYQWSKFKYHPDIPNIILNARSAHEAFKLSQVLVDYVDPDWNNKKVEIMKTILLVKFNQHEYVRHKLRQTGNRPIIEDSPKDSFWGWGPDKNGQNQLGKLWMEIRREYILS